MKKIINNFLKFGLSISLLLFLFLAVGPKEIYQNLTKINIFYIPLLMFMWYIGLLIGTINMNILIKPLKRDIEFLKLLKYYFLVWSISLITPGKLGEFSLIYFLKKEKIEMGKSSAILVLDKLITIGLHFIISLFGLFIFFKLNEIIWVIISFMLIFIFLLFFIFSYRGRNLIKKYVLREYSSKFEGFSETLKEYFQNHKKRLYLNLTMTFIRLIFTSYILYLTFILFNQEVKIIYIIIVYSVIAIVSFIPITFNGLGLKEISGVVLLSKLGISSTITTAVFTLILIITYIMALLNVLLIKHKIY